MAGNSFISDFEISKILVWKAPWVCGALGDLECRLCVMWIMASALGPVSALPFQGDGSRLPFCGIRRAGESTFFMSTTAQENVPISLHFKRLGYKRRLCHK